MVLQHGVRAASAFRPFALGLHAFGFSPYLPLILRTFAACLGGPQRAPYGDPHHRGPLKGDSSRIALKGDGDSCPQRPFLQQAFMRGAWEWLEVSARVAAANRRPSQQATEAFEASVSSPFFTPKQILESVLRVKEKYRKEVFKETEETEEEKDTEEKETEGDTRWLSRLYEDVIRFGYLMWEEVHVEGLIQVAS